MVWMHTPSRLAAISRHKGRAEYARSMAGRSISFRATTPALAATAMIASAAAEPMNVLEAHGVSKSFGRRQVLAGVDLEVAAGELAAVVGENGSGKSTLLRILAGDLRPDTGSVVTHGQVGYCPQAVVLDDALTVDQHIRYFLAAYRIGAAGRADTLIDRRPRSGRQIRR